jgi:hypothetical protein
MNRRSILKAIGLAPVAAPVIAREAASKAGIGVFDLGMAYPSDCVQGSAALGKEASYREWILSQIKDVFSQSYRDQIARSYGRGITRLDPDLASSRSLSLSSAIRIQRDRLIDQEIERAKTNALEQYKREFGVDWLL